MAKKWVAVGEVAPQQVADKESWPKWVGRNIVQGVARPYAGIMGLPGDISEAISSDLGLPKQPERLFPKEDVEPPSLTQRYLQSLAGQAGIDVSPLSEAEEELTRTAPTTQDIMQTLSPLIGQQREGDYLATGLAHTLPFLLGEGALRAPGALLSGLKSGVIPALRSGLKTAVMPVVRSGLKAGGMYAGGKLGETSGKYIGEKIGFPKTLELAGSAIGGFLGVKGLEKAVNVMKTLPGNYYAKNFDKKVNHIQKTLEETKNNAIKAADLEYADQIAELERLKVANTEQGRAKKERINNEYDNKIKEIETTHDKLLETFEDEVRSLESQAETIPEQAQIHRNMAANYYEQLNELINTKYDGKLQVNVPNLRKSISKLIEKHTAAVSPQTEIMIDNFTAKLLNELSRTEGKLDLQRARAFMEDLGDIGYESGATPTAKKAARAIRTEINDVISDNLTDMTAKDLWKQADQNYKQASVLSSKREGYGKGITAEQAKLRREYTKVEREKVSRPKTKAKEQRARQLEAEKDPYQQRQEDIKRMREESKQTRKEKLSQAEEEYKTGKSELEQMISDSQLDKAESFWTRIRNRGVTTAIAEGIGRAFGVSGWVKTLINVGGFAWSDIKRHIVAMERMRNAHPDIYANYIKGIREIPSGNFTQYAKAVAQINVAGEPKKKGRKKWVAI